jgi:hypothetical protein
VLQAWPAAEEVPLRWGWAKEELVWEVLLVRATRGEGGSSWVEWSGGARRGVRRGLHRRWVTTRSTDRGGGRGKMWWHLLKSPSRWATSWSILSLYFLYFSFVVSDKECILCAGQKLLSEWQHLRNGGVEYKPFPSGMQTGYNQIPRKINHVILVKKIMLPFSATE